MSNDNQSIVIQCAGCSAKLRLGASARGKTIACPKCGKQMKLKASSGPASDPAASKPIATQPKQSQSAPVQPTAAKPVAAKPIAAKPVAANPIAAKPIAPAAPAKNDWDDFQFPTAVAPYPQSPGAGAYTSPAYSNSPYHNPTPSKARNQTVLWLGIAGAASVLIIGIAVTLWMTLSSSSSPSASPFPTGPGQTAAIPVPATSSTASNPTAPNAVASKPSMPLPPGFPGSNQPIEFPDLGSEFPFGRSISLYTVTISRGMGGHLSMNIFIPKGDHPAQSLPVVFEAPAGTNLLHGANLDMPSFADEYLPFTKAGMITVSFSLDGPMPPHLTPEAGAQYVQQLSRAYKQFVASDAGVACGSLAIDYVLKKVPAADPKRLYVWGHSSAATLALLLASKDTRIAKCIAMAPVTDIQLRLGEMLTESSMDKFFPNLAEYLKNGSPVTHVSKLKCPVFIAHARDDDNEPFPNTQNYVKLLQRAGGNVTFDARASGGHYRELLDAAMPKAIEWLAP